MIRPVPGCMFDLAEEPQIGLDDPSLSGFGHFISSAEQLILELFGRRAYGPAGWRFRWLWRQLAHCVASQFRMTRCHRCREGY